jgi:hypothetical protein
MRPLAAHFHRDIAIFIFRNIPIIGILYLTMTPLWEIAQAELGVSINSDLFILFTHF